MKSGIQMVSFASCEGRVGCLWLKVYFFLDVDFFLLSIYLHPAIVTHSPALMVFYRFPIFSKEKNEAQQHAIKMGVKNFSNFFLHWPHAG